MGRNGAEPAAAVVANERRKLTANSLNAGAGSFFATGVVAPLAAAVFGIPGPSGGISTLILGAGALIFLLSSLALHGAARYVLSGLRS